MTAQVVVTNTPDVRRPVAMTRLCTGTAQKKALLIADPYLRGRAYRPHGHATSAARSVSLVREASGETLRLAGCRSPGLLAADPYADGWRAALGTSGTDRYAVATADFVCITCLLTRGGIPLTPVRLR
jgi:hypothetical protein